MPLASQERVEGVSRLGRDLSCWAIPIGRDSVAIGRDWVAIGRFGRDWVAIRSQSVAIGRDRSRFVVLGDPDWSRFGRSIGRVSMPQATPKTRHKKARSPNRGIGLAPAARRRAFLCFD